MTVHASLLIDDHRRSDAYEWPLFATGLVVGHA